VTTVEQDAEYKTHQLDLTQVLACEIKQLYRWPHLNRDTVVGFIGGRGAGKSGSCVETLLKDCWLFGEPVWSNVPIKLQIGVPDDVAGKYGVKGGVAVFESLPLDLSSLFFDDDPPYREGYINIEEYNIAVADARRTMSNQSLAAADWQQLLRKYDCGLTFNCIHEMFVDIRLRDMVDAFVLCEDSALTPEGLRAGKKQGVTVNQKVYPMSPRINGLTYAQNGQTFTRKCNLEVLWGAWDTLAKQQRVKLAPGRSGMAMDASLEMGDLSDSIQSQKNEYAWLVKRIEDLSVECHNKRWKVEEFEIENDVVRGYRIASFKLWESVGKDSDWASSRKNIRALNALQCFNTNIPVPKGHGTTYWVIPAPGDLE
jgi:hypothetical protein